MFRNYLAAALGNLVRNKLYAAINIVGLAAGLTAALLIALFVRDEFSYDKWIPEYERVYAVHSTVVDRSDTVHYTMAPSITAGLLAQDFSHQISAITRFLLVTRRSVGHGDVEYSETIMWAEPNLFKVLPLPAIAGNPATALQEPDGIVLTRSMARKYFGRDNPIGETLEVDRKFVMRVTAVLEDLPSNTYLTNPQLNLGIIASGRNANSAMTQYDKAVPPSGPIPPLFTYLRLAPGASADSLKEALPAFERQHPRFQSPPYSYSLDLMPLADLHLHAPFDPRLTTGSAATAFSALWIALLIVAIASINFVNLTTARATRRAVEVGVRKVSGAERWNLIIQFIGESTIYAVLGMALATLFAHLLLPSFNGFLQRTIVFDYVRDPRLLGAMLIVVGAVGILAGAYPALVLSRFSPAAVLKGSLTGGLRSGVFRGGRGRQVLVALQFMVLVVLALVSTTIYRQAHYAMNEALRFDKDQVLVINTSGLGDVLPCDSAFTTAVRALPGVRGVACASSEPIPSGWNKTGVTGSDGATAKTVQMLVDFGYFDLFGIKTLAGRAFTRDFAGDLGPQDGATPPSVVINETLSRMLGFAEPQSAIGQSVRWHPAGPFGDAALAAFFAKTAPPDGPSQIVGVVPDFALASARQATEPGIFWISSFGQVGKVDGSVLDVKLRGSQVPETLKAIDKLWKQLGLPRPIRRSFLDQQIENKYRDVTLLSDAMAAFAAVAVFVACLGLFGLATFAAESRTKEIGVRKALGASRADILRLMLWEFNKPVLWASLIAWPVAYFIMRRWLEGFAVRVDMGLELFPMATALVFVIAVLTVAGHALLVARSQPVKALRYE
jgi:putative ABC transport system permease protein